MKFLLKNGTNSKTSYLESKLAIIWPNYLLDNFIDKQTLQQKSYNLLFAFIPNEKSLEADLKQLKEDAAQLPIILIFKNQPSEKVNDFLDHQVQDYLIDSSYSEHDLSKAVNGAINRHKVYYTSLKSHESYQEVLSHLTDSIDEITYEWDVYSNRIRWSDNLHKQLGYSSNELDNIQKWMSKSHPEELQETSEALEFALSGKESDQIRKYQIKKASGEYISIEDKVKIIKNTKGQVCRIIGILIDVTKKNADKIRAAQSEDNYTRIFNQGPMAMLIFRLEDLMIINVNKPALDLYKYPLDGIIGKKVDFLVSQENIYAFNHALSKLERNGEPQTLGEWKHIIANEEEIDVEVIGRSIEIDGVLCIMLSCNNISLRVKAISELKRANEQFELVKKATQDIIWDYDVVNDRLILDYKFQNAFGYTREELDIDLETWRYFIHPKESKRVSSDFIKTLKDNSITKWQATYRVRRKDDTFAEVEDQAIIIRNSNGEALRVIGSIRDITERKEKDKQLLTLKNSLEQISDSILITDARPIDEPGPRIIYANNAFYRQTGYTAKEVIGQTPRILQGEKTERAELDKLKAALIKKEPCTVELLNYKKNGEEFFVELTVDPVFDESGNCEFFTSVQRDISERKEKEAENRLFKRLSVGINEFSSLKERYEFVISMLTDYIGCDAAEGWMTTIDMANLQRISTYFTNAQNQNFFNTEISISHQKFEGIQGKTLKDRRIVFLNDLPNNDAFIRSKEITDTDLNSAVAVPIFATNLELIGVIVFYDKEKEIKLSQTAINILNTISERLGSELQRMRTANEFSSFFNITPDLMCVMSKDGYFKKVNKAFIELTGFNEDDIKKVRAIDFIHEDDREQTRQEFKRIIQGQNKISDYYECRYITKSQKIINLVWTSIFDPDQNVVYAVAKNITDQKTLQELIINSNNLQKHVINSTEGFIWAIDRNYKLILANDAYLANMRKYTGKMYKIGERVISKTSKKWAMKDSHKQLWRNNYKKALLGNNVDFIYKTIANGEEVNQAISMRPIDSTLPGELPIGVACFSKDITPSVKYTEEIESKNLQLSEIAHIQAHKVRGPLSRILGLANLLMSYKDDNTHFIETLNKLLGAANELDGVIRDIVKKTYTIELNKQEDHIYKKSG